MLDRPSRISLLPDVWDPEFSDRYAAWKKGVQLEIESSVQRTMEAIAQSRDLMAKIDRVLSQK